MRLSPIAVLAIGLPLSAFHAKAAPAKPPTAPHFSSLSNAIASAERSGSTKEGRDYQGMFYSTLDEPMNNAMAACSKAGEPASNLRFDLVFVIATDGRVVDLLYPARHPVAACVAARLRGLELPPPPKANWLVHVNMTPP